MSRPRAIGKDGLLVAACFAGLIACATPRSGGSSGASAQTNTIARTTALADASTPSSGGSSSGSTQPNDLVQRAIADARSNDANRHTRLLEALESPKFLEQLDSPADYAEAARTPLHVDQVVESLARNVTPSAQRAFLELTTQQGYVGHSARVNGLIRASVHVRPAPPELVSFWDRHSVQGDGYTPLTIMALIENASGPAFTLLEKKMRDPSHLDDEKIGWLRSDFLGHRNEPALLSSCERLLRGGLRNSLRPRLVEVLFDYRPEEWFGPDSVQPAPPLESASRDALLQMRRIAQYVLGNVALAAKQTAAVKQRLLEIDRLLQSGTH